MKEKITCFLPCRAGSERVVRKNVKPFAGHEHGLLQIKLGQLLSTEMIDEIVLSTNDEEILRYAEKLSDTRLRLHRRDDELASSETSTDELVAHALSLIPDGHILWTHVTSPFVNAQKYTDIISTYIEQSLSGFDSLMTTTAIHGFLWQDGHPLNYDRKKEKWPRTQTINPVDEVNSGVFLAPAEVYRQREDRIGIRPYLYRLDKLTSFDIDWPEDFVVAECMLESKIIEI